MLAAHNAHLTRQDPEEIRTRSPRAQSLATLVALDIRQLSQNPHDPEALNF